MAQELHLFEAQKPHVDISGCAGTRGELDTVDSVWQAI